MDAPEAELPCTRKLLALASVAILSMAACAPQAVAPTAAPAPPAPTAAPAKPAPTAAPAKAEAPAARPAATAAPAAKPTEKPAAKPAEFDEKAVADFYKGKTLRIIIGQGPGGATDTTARLTQRLLSRYIPGSPSIVAENRPSGGGLLAANTVYTTEPKDGTAIGAFGVGLALQQAIGAPGVQFDAAKFNWLTSAFSNVGACAARTDSGITRLQDLMDGGKELAVSSYGKGGPSYNPPAAMNIALGTRFKIVTGYESGAQQRLAVKNNEVQGFCTSFEDMDGPGRDMFEGPTPLARVIVVTGDRTPDHPLLKGVPAAEALARTDEGKALLRIVHGVFELNMTTTAAPEVPRDRVQALRRAYDKTYVDPEFIDGAQKLGRMPSPKTGEEVTRIIQAMLGTPPATLARLKEVLE